LLHRRAHIWNSFCKLLTQFFKDGVLAVVFACKKRKLIYPRVLIICLNCIEHMRLNSVHIVLINN